MGVWVGVGVVIHSSEFVGESFGSGGVELAEGVQWWGLPAQGLNQGEYDSRWSLVAV